MKGIIMKHILFVFLLALSGVALTGCAASIDIDPPHHHYR